MLSHEAVAWICLIHLSVFIAVLLIKKENRRANRMLAVFMAGLAIGHLNHLLVLMQVAWKVFYLNELVFVIPYFMGPAFLQYTVYMTGERFNWRKHGWIHFLPALFFLPYYISFFFDQPEERQKFYELCLHHQPISNSILLSVLTAQLTLYMLLSLRLQNRYHQRIRQTSSYRWLQLRWLTTFTILWLFICLVISPVLIVLSDSDVTALLVITPAITTILYLFLFLKAVSSRGKHYEQRLIRELERRKISHELYDELNTSITRIHMLSEAAKHETDTTASGLEEISRQSKQLTRNLRQLIRKLNTEGKS